ncbi:MAG: acetyl-CoA carboxylase carboxyl transferase subunit beta, partial [Verrucomicrobiota bacterium]|nr:acetyl-CoA carboxylase carboxyl transferase subunit beta [Verrucomicrobiota bacterium]
MAIFKRPVLKTQIRRKREIPQGLWQKCPGCSAVVHEIELAQNQRVCPHCEYHFAQSAKERLADLLDIESFTEHDADLRSIDTLRFQGMATYKDRLTKYQESTGLTDAVLSGDGLIEGYKVAIAVMDFSFLAATMGSVVGERITRIIEHGTAARSPVIIISASGGAR